MPSHIYLPFFLSLSTCYIYIYDHFPCKPISHIAHDHLVFCYLMPQSRFAMDWFSWLSRSGLEPSLTYEYGLAFARNELQEEDLSHFNHEFLQSMGISVAKHRLEILKLAKKEVGANTTGISKFILAINKTKKSLKKCISKLVFHEESVFKALPEPLSRYRDEQSTGVFTRKFQVEKPPVLRTRIQAKSGPLDGSMPENLMLNHRNLKLSGPLDGRLPENLMPIPNNRSVKLSGPLDVKMQEKLVFAHRRSNPVQQSLMAGGRSPRIPRPLDGLKRDRVINDDFDDQSQWAHLFEDLKPT
ncbi:uncharacterized protein LOC110600412 [Manihot esculenta]|uniref:Uncharacterized protein n=2 Tax=Manihot esculenta TaxID=3983 RepID=A0ACB7GI03_MANES|nr:uncharacterized protein LOC110600412 [Manihot esculenta]KAG8639365.1 hypothetical protein MANES_14G121200v8 [Manihot esculenta]